MSRISELLVYTIKNDETSSLADTAGYFQDLTFAADALHLLKDQFDKLSTVEAKSLWTAALIAYARCFAYGKRAQLSHDIYNALDGEPHKVHEYMISMRNRHLAHSINPFEEVSVGAVVNGGKVESIVTLSVSHLFPEKNALDSLYRLVCIAREHVATRAKRLEKECLESVQQLPIETILEGDRMGYVTPGPDSAKKIRGGPKRRQSSDKQSLKRNKKGRYVKG